MTERMYSDLADWWHLLSAVDEYVEEAALFSTALLEHAVERPRTLLELGSGGGNNAFHLKSDFEMTYDHSDLPNGYEVFIGRKRAFDG